MVPAARRGLLVVSITKGAKMQWTEEEAQYAIDVIDQFLNDPHIVEICGGDVLPRSELAETVLADDEAAEELRACFQTPLSIKEAARHMADEFGWVADR